MVKSNPYRPFTPCESLPALVPDVSGNRINGLDETKSRPPRYVFWNDPDKLAHGAMQRWFYQNDPDNLALKHARKDREKISCFDLPPAASKPVLRSAEQATAALLAHTMGLNFEMTGITAMRPEYLFEGAEIDHKWVIMVGVVHNYEALREAPGDVAGAEVVRQYGRATRAVLEVCAWIHEQGYDAEPHAGPLAGKLLMIPPAIACGFGELGKHGSMISPLYGANFRLAAVVTSMPLMATQGDPIRVEDFCKNCRICEDVCPPLAIQPDKKMVRGTHKWYVDFDKCIPFFNENFGCAMCIAACPWSRPDTAPHLAAKLARRHARLVKKGSDKV